jgi:hypothetical protein
VVAAERSFIGSNCAMYPGDSLAEVAGDSVKELKRKLRVVNSQLKSKAQARRQPMDIHE